MKMLFARTLVVAVALLWPLSRSYAGTTNTATCHITSLAQWGDQTVAVSTDLTSLISVAGCSTCSGSTGQFWLQTVSGQPSYGSMIPLIMAAYLYNKPVVFTVSTTSCVSCLPEITAITISE